MRRLEADLLLLACAAVWGFAFVMQKTAMDHVGPFLFVALRSLVAALALLPLTLIETRRAQAAGKPLAAVGRPAVIAGLAFSGGAALQQVGLTTASVTNAGFLTALYVVLTPFIAWAFDRIAPAPVIWAAAAISFVGAWLLAGGTVGALAAGDLLVVASAAFWALHVVLLSRAARLGRPVLFTALQFAVVAAMAGVIALSVEDVRAADVRSAVPEILYLGVLSSALAFTVFTLALRHTPPAEAAIIVSTETLFAAAGAWAVLGERLTLLGWQGAGLILAAILLVQLYPALRRPLRSGGARRAANGDPP